MEASSFNDTSLHHCGILTNTTNPTPEIVYDSTDQRAKLELFDPCWFTDLMKRSYFTVVISKAAGPKKKYIFFTGGREP